MAISRQKVTPPPVITAGEPVRETWCPICQAPWRLRIPLLADGVPCGGLEICPGCGTGHDKAGIYVTPQDGAPDVASPAPGPRGPLLPRIACALHARSCKRHGLMAMECAHGTCPWPGLWRHALEMDGDEGTWRYVFCRASHRRAWAAENGVVG